MRKTTKSIGDYGEALAENYLKKRGYKILSRNFRVRGGEIDIIGYRFGVLVFFEVKARSGDEYGAPRDAVDDEKIKNIRKAAKIFLQTYREFGKISMFYPFGIELKRKIRKQRLDVIEVFLPKAGEKLRINHIKDWEKQL